MHYNSEIAEQPYIKLNITNDEGSCSMGSTQLKNIHFLPKVGEIIFCDVEEFQKFGNACLFKVTGVLYAFDKQKQKQITINAVLTE